LHQAVAEAHAVDNLLAVAGNPGCWWSAHEPPAVTIGPSARADLPRRTDLDTLRRELDGIRALSDGLRAQRHELSNRLYTLSGLLQLGHNGEAVDYVQPRTETSSTRPSADPYLQALLVAKTEQAQE
jgi:two-component system CitB family sensor kinase